MSARRGSPAPTPAQARVIAAALELFARNGVGGTSLQMIADEIGVTKAAVYHQFPTKEAIIVAAAATELARFESVIATAEQRPSARGAREAVVTGFVDMAIDNRRTMGSILSDPVVVGSFAEQEDFRHVMHRLRAVLFGDDAGPEARVRTAMLIAAISGAAMHPFVSDLDDTALRTELLRLGRAILRASA